MSSSGRDLTRPARFRAHAAVIRRNRLLGPAAITAAALIPVVIGASSIAHLPSLLLVIPLLLAAGVGGGIFALTENPWTSDVEAEIEVKEEGVLEDGRLLVARGELRAGFVVPDPPHGPRVRLQRRRKLPVEIRVEDESQGRALLRALGLDASQRSATFSTPSRALTDQSFSIFIGLTFAAFYVLLGFFGHTLVGRGVPLQIPILMVYLGFMFLTRTSITVGADGVLRSWLSKKEFWSYGDIADVNRFLDQSMWRKQKWMGVELQLRSGERVRLPITSKNGLQTSQLDLIIERIREAMESHRQGEPAADTALLARQARPVADWIQSLRAIGSGAHVDHRTAPVGPERLFRIVEDPSLAPSMRAGAAVALGASLDEEGKERLKGAAGAIAAPKLRIAIEAAADGDEAALTEALAAIEGEAEKRAHG
jgi:hypothetical protein